MSVGCVQSMGFIIGHVVSLIHGLGLVPEGFEASWERKKFVLMLAPVSHIRSKLCGQQICGLVVHNNDRIC